MWGETKWKRAKKQATFVLTPSPLSSAEQKNFQGS